MAINMNKIVELESRLGMNLLDEELSAVMTYLEGGNNLHGMDFHRACEITDGLFQQAGYSF